MTRCDNCENPASYTQADPGVNPVNYCQKCLPGWLYDRALAGHFPLVTPVVDEEKPVEESPAEEDDSKKRKKTSKNENN